MLHCNIRGLRSSRVELEASIRLMDQPPAILCLNETFLDKSVEELSVTGYECVARKDREDGWGGVAVYAATKIASRTVLLKISGSAERCWLCLHTSQGPYLLCCWYRPPHREVETIDSFLDEHAAHRKETVGTVVVGDVNVHHDGWLTFSSGTCPAKAQKRQLTNSCFSS